MGERDDADATAREDRPPQPSRTLGASADADAGATRHAHAAHELFHGRI